MSSLTRLTCIAITALTMVGLCGCSTSNAKVKTAGGVITLDGTHYLVVGFGIVSVSKTETPVAAQVMRGQVLGLQISNQPGLKLAVGYSDGQTVLVPAEKADDVRLEARQNGSVIQVTVDRAQLKQDPLP